MQNTCFIFCHINLSVNCIRKVGGGKLKYFIFIRPTYSKVILGYIQKEKKGKNETVKIPMSMRGWQMSTTHIQHTK